MTSQDWERRLAVLWSELDQHDPEQFIGKMTALTSELGADNAITCFELASANDSTSREAQAEPLYRRALALGLTGIRRRRATIQLASTLRNLGKAAEGAELLRAEMARGSDELDDAVVATLALCLTELGREREAVGLAVGALARHLPRYNRSMANYAKALIKD
jgi:Arc/MetJ family transcription regulator